MTKIEAEVVIALADNNLKVEQTAKVLYMHRSSLSRYIRKIKKDYRLDPLNFYDMCWLLPKAKMVAGKYGNFYEKEGVSDD